MQNYLRAKSTRKVASVSLAVVTVIAAAVGVTIWRYQVAQANSVAAGVTSDNSIKANELLAIFWHEREAMNDYLVLAVPAIVGEIGDSRTQFSEIASDILPQTPQAAQAIRGGLVTSAGTG